MNYFKSLRFIPIIFSAMFYSCEQSAQINMDTITLKHHHGAWLLEGKKDTLFLKVYNEKNMSAVRVRQYGNTTLKNDYNLFFNDEKKNLLYGNKLKKYWKISIDTTENVIRTEGKIWRKLKSYKFPKTNTGTKDNKNDVIGNILNKSKKKKKSL